MARKIKLREYSIGDIKTETERALLARNNLSAINSSN